MNFMSRAHIYRRPDDIIEMQVSDETCVYLENEPEFKAAIEELEYWAGHATGLMHKKFNYVPIYDKGKGSSWIEGFTTGYNA